MNKKFWNSTWNAREISVVAGTNLLRGGNEQVYEAEYVVWHENYSGSKYTNDVGLIRVNRTIEFNDKVRSTAVSNEDFLKVDYPAVLTGWGKLSASGSIPNQLQFINLKVIGSVDCERKLGLGIRITDSHICTLTRAGQGACFVSFNSNYYYFLIWWLQFYK